MKQTDYQLLMTLDDFEPKSYGILSDSEIKQIENALLLKQRRNIVELQNLRNFTVLYYSKEIEHQITEKNCKEQLKLIDKLSAITSVIDHYIFALGGEV